ncbi:MAG: peptidoglycan DD-metalloendopeptidase family protein [Saprospiraceae bacterium]|nr:peptidoglycan DD-metalloendopeptidase family protein [Saprospiraceae bacterium]
MKFSNKLFILLTLAALYCQVDETGMDTDSIKFITTPVLSGDHNRSYQYQFKASSSLSGAVITYEVSHPSWMNYAQDQQLLSGIPDWANVNKNEKVIIKASDGATTVTQEFNINIKLGEIICDTPIGSPKDSPYVLPFEVGKSRVLSQGACPSNPSWGHHNWFAYDFDMPIGSNIVAARAGEVLHIEERWTDGNRTMGQANYVYIMHDDGTVAEYYHLTKDGVLVNIGDRVKQGQVIALSGDTGPSIGPHLHFVVYRSRWEFSKYQRQYTLPVNFKNAEGTLDSNNGLVYQEYYKALAY